MPDLSAWIGREARYEAPEEIGAAAFRLFARAIGEDGPHGGRAPPTLVCETCQPYDQTPDAAGYFGHLWDLPLQPSFMRGGNEYEFHQELRAEDRIAVTWRITAIERRETRGGTLVFVTSEARYTNQRGELLAVNRETNIHRP